MAMGSLGSSYIRDMSGERPSDDGEPWRIQIEEHDKSCECKKLAIEQTSWTKPNPARRFWNCKNLLKKNGPKYGWFLWKDEELDDGYYKDKLYEMRMDVVKKDKLLAKKGMTTNVIDLQKNVKELELLLGGKNKEIWRLKMKCFLLLFVLITCVMVLIVE